MYRPRKQRPSRPQVPGRCPCGEPGQVTIWEADILLCGRHGRAWLASEEKIAAGAATFGDDPAGLLAALDHFVERIRKRWIGARIWRALSARSRRGSRT